MSSFYDDNLSAPQEGDAFDETEEEFGGPSAGSVGSDFTGSPRWGPKHYAQRSQPYGYTQGAREYVYGYDAEKRRNVRQQDYYDPTAVTYGFEADLVMDIGSILRKTIAFAGAHTAKTLIALAKDIKSQAHKEVYVEASQQVARQAQKQIIARYLRARRESSRRGTGSYRTDERFAGGMLEDGLRDPALLPVNPNNGAISITPAILNGYALQWARLNYGAGAGSAPQTFPIRGSNLLLANVGLPPNQRPSFSIPYGFWTGGASGRGQFFPFGHEPPTNADLIPQLSKSGLKIKAENWLDAGVQYIADNAGRAWLLAFRDKVYRPAAEQAAQEGRSNTKFNVRPSVLTRVGVTPRRGLKVGDKLY